jgi:hypothetical protein
MIKINISITTFIDPEDLPPIYLDEVSLTEFIEESLAEGLDPLYPREVVFNHIDIEGLS